MTVLSRRVSRVAERADRRFLPEIQPLRAVAVTLVVLFHGSVAVRASDDQLRVGRWAVARHYRSCES